MSSKNKDKNTDKNKDKNTDKNKDKNKDKNTDKNKNKEEEMSEEDLEAWREAFDLFDKNKNGTISVAELGTVLRALDMNPTEAQVREAAKKLDFNGDGHIKFDDFVRLMKPQRRGRKAEEDDLMRAFKLMDRDGNQLVDADELRRVVSQLGEPLSPEQVEEMIRSVDVNKDGKIDYKEFVKLMTSPCL